ncbi:hypothetical protein OK349_07095 [Sphingomonas sp. BT-65]|uniref:hypothetical protein n=1 Tax=Sphingomonas sp. BT-65 TaxID=2989821 RepID=UPI002235F593|nr:hypothetical protein [Sphingomonas sp. BT-65]MCW4461469.1 hypothetical protein [Sphingomonas sp. BT-65]
MDLNELLHRQQVALMCAGAAQCAEARIAHQGMASLYEERIRAIWPPSDENAPIARDRSVDPERMLIAE